MLSIQEIKKLIGDKNISDKEIQEIRDACYQLADLATEKYPEDKKENLKNDNCKQDQ